MRESHILNSTAVLSVTCDLDDANPQSIDVTFVNGNTYTHDAVPLTVVQALVDAPSAGRYYAAHLKGKFAR